MQVPKTGRSDCMSPERCDKSPYFGDVMRACKERIFLPREVDRIPCAPPLRSIFSQPSLKTGVAVSHRVFL